MLRRAAAVLARYVVAVLCCPYLFTAGFLRARHRSLVYAIAAHFGWRPRSRKPSGTPVPLLPLRGFAEAVGEPRPITLMAPDATGGNVSLTELLVINHLVAARRPRACFEIGTFDGRTTLNLAANAGTDARVWTLDLPAQASRSTDLPIETGDLKYIRKPDSGSRFLGTQLAVQIEQLFGDSARFDFTPYAKRIDFVFVDGSHSL